MDTLKRNKRIIMILTIFTIIFTFFGASLAYWNWETVESQKTNVVFTLTQDFSCAADGGGDITSTDAFIAPAKCTSENHAIKREVKVTPTIFRKNLTIYMELWLKVNSLDSGLKNSDNFKYAFTTSSESCTEGVISQGNLKNLNSGDTKVILNRNFSSSTPATYYLWVWLDEAETSTSTMDQSFSLTLDGACTDNQVLVVPDGGMYMVGTPENEVNPSQMSYSMKKLATNNVCNYENAVVYNSGEVVTVVPSTCDKYLFGDYEYIYNAHIVNQSIGIDESLEGWGVININSTNASPGQILSTVNNKDVVSMSETFKNSNIVTAPTIPSTIKNMNSTFNGCGNLKGMIKINANPITYSNIFAGISNSIKIFGTSSKLDEMANSAINNNVIVVDNVPEAPVLDDGMIPVKLSSNGTLTTVSPSDPTWYNYENKEWANVVLVDDDSRITYKNTTGVTVNQDDILAYYVWIPRYKYQIWTTEESATGEEQTIEIKFESAMAAMSLGTEVGEWRTHPAFWWDDNSDGNVDSGETVAGIWVGKFETSANTDSICYEDNTEEDCVSTEITPRIVPNVSSLRYQKVSEQFLTSLKFSANGNIYGLSHTSTNAHMMKNSEWGAVAYLSHSKYGINDEIRVNNNWSYITGCGSTNINDESIGTRECQISYNSGYTPQSTTGNITGIFDMSGGAYEYVMGVLADSNGKPRGGYNEVQNSGFNGLLFDDISYIDGIDFPASKYYDLYTGGTAFNSCNGGLCYGYALSETSKWYGDLSSFVNLVGPWFSRGGYNNNGSKAGVFLSAANHGYTYGYDSWRSVLVVGYGP